MNTSKAINLAQSIHTTLTEGGVDKDIADALLSIAIGATLIVQASSDSGPPTIDTEIRALEARIEREMKRSSTNLTAILRTTCRDCTSTALQAKIECILQEHVKFEMYALSILVDRRAEAKPQPVKTPKSA